MGKFDTLDAVGQRILKAYITPTDWRTLGGIAREAGLDITEVESYIHQHPEIFRIFPRNKTPFYGLTDQFRKYSAQRPE